MHDRPGEPTTGYSSQRPTPTLLGRRELLRLGLTGFAGLSLSDLYRLQAASGAVPQAERTAVILVWLRGGASHLETFDPKPLAPNEYRGPYKPIATSVPGTSISELLPRHAQIAHRFNILRSMAHTGPGHPAGSLQLLSGDPAPQDKQGPVFPDFLAIANHARSRADTGRTLPNYVGVNGVTDYDGFKITGPAYLGPAFAPFLVNGDPNQPDFKVPNIALDEPLQQQLRERVSLSQRLDGLRRDLDQSASLSALNKFQTQAVNLLTSPQSRAAFDVSLEPDRVRDRYGRNRWGQQLLMTRRLVEAGVELVSTELTGPPCGRVQNWDDHAVNHNVFEAMKFRAPVFDQAVTALIDDIYERGLDKRVLVIVAGEFGRTPRISNVASSGGGDASAAAGVVQPGRDHWPNANSILFAGGNMRTGQVIGATDRRGEEVVERRVAPADFLATVFQHLGVDVARVPDKEFSGRPSLVLSSGTPIKELCAK
jgi:uncharacterized protein (DUF1501 family)